MKNLMTLGILGCLLYSLVPCNAKSATILFTLFNQSNVYALPFKAEDLKPGERYSTGNHAGGIQAKGEDFGAKRYKGNNNWSHLKKGKSGNNNADFLIYNKPFYAMADGEVCGCWRNAPENPVPGERHQAKKDKLMSGGGNLIWVLQNNGVYALYAHAIPGIHTYMFIWKKMETRL